MVGILDYKGRAPSWAPMTIDGSAPTLPAQRGGMFDWFQDDPGAINATDGSGGRGPRTAQQKQSLLFGGIADAIDNLQGRNGDTTETLSKQYADDYTKQKAEQRRQAVNAALQAAYASGDMNQVRAALLQADPEDLGHIHDAITMMQPKIHDIAGGGYAESPITGALSQVVAPLPKAPPTRTYQSGLDSITETQDPVTGAWTRLGAGPKFAPHAPPKPAAAPMQIGIPNPAFKFRGR